MKKQSRQYQLIEYEESRGYENVQESCIYDSAHKEMSSMRGFI